MSEGSDEWFYLQGADRQGPVSFDILKALLQNRVLKESTLVWTQSFGDDWNSLKDVLGKENSGLIVESNLQKLNEKNGNEIRSVSSKFFRHEVNIFE